MIYEEWYFKKLSEARDTKCEAIETKQPEIHDQVLLLLTFSIESCGLSNSLSLFRMLYRRPLAIVGCAGSNTSVDTVDPLQRLTRSLTQPWKVTPTFLVGTTFQWGRRGTRIARTRMRLLNLELSFRMIRLKIKYLDRSHFGKRFNFPTSRNSTYLDTPFQEFDQIGDRKIIELWSSSVKRSETKDSLGEKKPTFKETRLRGFNDGNGWLVYYVYVYV